MPAPRPYINISTPPCHHPECFRDRCDKAPYKWTPPSELDPGDEHEPAEDVLTALLGHG